MNIHQDILNHNWSLVSKSYYAEAKTAIPFMSLSDANQKSLFLADTGLHISSPHHPLEAMLFVTSVVLWKLSIQKL